jgi:hypothetical protein
MSLLGWEQGHRHLGAKTSQPDQTVITPRLRSPTHGDGLYSRPMIGLTQHIEAQR